MKKLLFLISMVLLVSCGKENVNTDANTKVKEQAQETIDANGNGGQVVEYKGNTYFVKPDDDKPMDSNIYAIYVINESVTEKFTDIALGYVYDFYIDDDYMYFTDIKVGDENYDDFIVKMSLDTKEKEYLQIGEIEFVDTENDEIYYTVEEYKDDIHKSNIYKMDNNGENIIELAIGNYSFIDIINDVVYLENYTRESENDIILSSVNSDGTNLKKLLVTTEGSYLTEESENFSEKEDFDYEYQNIIDLGVYKDTIYLTIGGYEGTGNFYYGGLIKVGINGEGFEPVLEYVEYFDIIDNNLYYYFDDVKYDEGGIYKINLDTDEKDFLGKEIDALKAVVDDNLFIEYKINTDNGVSTYNLSKYNTETEEITTLYDGTMAPVKEDSDYIDYQLAEVAGDYIYFYLQVHGYNETVDSWRGHLCHGGYYRVKTDGSGLELLYENTNQKCPE